MSTTGPRYLYFNSRDELYRIEMQNIVYIEADGNYTHLILRSGQRGTVCMSLMQMHNVLNTKLKEQSAHFARVGKRYIINLQCVYHINTLKQQLTLSDGATFSHDIGISKEALRQLKELFVKHI
ncbi:MAG: LytTR family transcriptional regulator DNA-binding domain-containing protein [Bacteroidales bacterium]|nr:LytTR family transcriptional regulator DNA-binding domain-containing protein [Bacteroidales bacterium]